MDSHGWSPAQPDATRGIATILGPSGTVPARVTLIAGDEAQGEYIR